ncbi:MAG: hypothetical protein Q4C63_08490 [Eubacteriales bacterium]|nr:hypothetical protein [Eubacteriales bacterium]
MLRTAIKGQQGCKEKQVNCRRICGSYDLSYRLKKQKHRKKTLQAQSTPVIIEENSRCPDGSCPACRSSGERWLYEECRLKKRIPASLTIEAALCLPVFLFAALILLAPMKMMDEKRQLQNVMEAAAKDMAQAAYIERLLEEEGSGFLSGGEGTGNGAEQDAGKAASEGSGEGSLFEGFTEGIKNGLNTGYTAGRVLASLNGAVIRNPYFEACDILRSDMIEMELHYDMRLPFPVFGIESIPMSSVVNRRAWTGSEGGRGADRYGPGNLTDGDGSGYDLDEEGDEVVYIGKTSTVYHKSRKCHYLDNVLKPVSGDTVDTLRNASGGKYHACTSCRPGTGGTVYIMENGTAYHRDGSCRAIGAYVEEIKRKDAAHLDGCSYCTKGSHA